MASTCPIDLDVAGLRSEVQTMYSRVASAPDGEFHYHRGPEYAAARLGYDASELAALPSPVTSSFAGVGNPPAIGRIPAGQVVLDVSCGAGTDLLLAAMRVGPHGRAIGPVLCWKQRSSGRFSPPGSPGRASQRGSRASTAPPKSARRGDTASSA
jgi:arsenite methyltransferase